MLAERRRFGAMLLVVDSPDLATYLPQLCKMRATAMTMGRNIVLASFLLKIWFCVWWG